jgi:hypothetical protein
VNINKKYEQNIIDLWDMSKTSNPIVTGIVEGAEVQGEGIENIFNKINSKRISKVFGKHRRYLEYQTDE